jgi:membrane associated rhomboid family serine protease
MILPIRTDSPLRRTPYMNWALIAANFVVYFLEVASNPQDPGQADFVQNLMLQPAAPHLWQYFTYAFLHANLLHIFGNMIFLYIFGNNINDRMGNLGYLCFYLAGAVFAGIGYVLFEPNNPVLGASGAVAAVTGAYLILMPHSNITIVYWFFFIGVAEIASLWFILFFFLMDVVGEVAPQFMGGAEAVAHTAHISGTIFGASLCFILLALHLLPRDQFDVLALASRWNRRRQYRDLVGTGFDPFGNAKAPPARMQSRTPDPFAERAMDLRGQIGLAFEQHNLPRAAAIYQDLIGMDSNQVLARSAQLDMANYLAAQQLYPQAAQAYEQFERYYKNYDQIEQVHLMLGLIYARYLNQPAKAKDYLRRAMERLRQPNQLELAKIELEHLDQTI